MEHHLRPAAGDLLELDLSSAGGEGLLLYPRCPRPRSSLVALVDSRIAGAEGRALFRSLLVGIPSARHAVRLRAEGALSLFFPIDIPPLWVGPLAAALGLERLGGRTAALLRDWDRPACGIAVEAADGEALRLRFYAMCTGADDLARLSGLVRDRLAMNLAGNDGIGELLESLARCRSEIVVSFGGRAGSPVSVKVELPAVPFPEVPEALDLAPGERRAHERTLSLAGALKVPELSYLGVRRYADGARELTFYLDLSHLVEAPR